MPHIRPIAPKVIRKLKTFVNSRWTFPFVMVLLLTITLSVRMLSDPDLGTHLSGGRWITEHQTVPQNDFSTYTVSNHQYIDIYWIFQLLLYGVYSIGGYVALSLLVTALSLVLFCLLYYRNESDKLSTGIGLFVLMLGFLVIEPRLILRPELFTYIFIASLVFILDLYVSGGKNLLFILPVIMLVWCNMQGLFVLGLIIILVYVGGKLISDRKPDAKLGLFLLVSVLVCLVNPYFLKGFLFPFELFTRLEGENIFHQHIRELSSLTSLDKLFIKDILFLSYTVLCIVAVLVTIRKRKIHEWVLLMIFLYLAMISVRNIPLFVVISLPVLSRSLNDIRTGISDKLNVKWLISGRRIVWWLCVIIPVLLIPRLFTNAYYRANSSNSKTGLGIDIWYQPVRAAELIHKNSLHFRFINSLAFGGWLGWSLQEPVFIDGRLEVMQDAFYREVVDSWNGKLPGMINKYKPKLIVYNYLKYFPWTVQLKKMPEWKLIYLDGFSAVFAIDSLTGSRLNSNLLKSMLVSQDTSKLGRERTEAVLKKKFSSGVSIWFAGFYKPVNNQNEETLNKASMLLQLGFYEIAGNLFLQYLDSTEGANFSVYYALADIYRFLKLKDLERICYERILEDVKDDPVALNALEDLDKTPALVLPGAQQQQPSSDAVNFFNQGNNFFNSGQVEKALVAYNEAIRINPGYVKALNNRGILLASSFRRFREAISDFTEVIRLEPSNADAFLGRGSCHFQLNDTEKACQDWEKSYKLGKQGAGLLLDQHCGKQRK